MRVDPAAVFGGTVLVAAPHMDDCVLGCGGTLALLPDKARIHVVYATDGSRSPAPALPWLGRVDRDLAALRSEEARHALGHIGIGTANVHFLGLPDGRLARRMEALDRGLAELMGRLAPDVVFAPFRFDRHADHIALNRAVASLMGRFGYRMIEYFVYHRWRLLPEGDVRRYLRPGLLMEVDTAEVAGTKRAALDLFRSQTTRYFPWQTRPNLRPEVLDGVAAEPEAFLAHSAELTGAAVFDRLRPWILLAHRLEPALKKRKDQVAHLFRRATGGPSE